MSDYLINKYKDEARDLIEELESALLLLDDNPDEPEIVNRIFRALHSLKGSGSMFGFDEISEFTHGLETVYDEIRANRLKITPGILNLTLNSVDVLRKFLSSEDGIDEELAANAAVLKSKILSEAGISEKDLGTFKGLKELEKEVVPIEDKDSKYKIFFQPGKEILKTGNNPFYMLDELYSIGEVKVLWNNSDIPDLEKMDIYQCYSSWKLEIITRYPIEQISEVFIFIEEESTIKIEEIPEIKEVLPQPENIQTEEKPLQTKLPEITQPTIRVSSNKLDTLMNLVSELVTLQARLDLFSKTLDNQNITNLAESLDKLSRQLRDTTFDICMVPLNSIVLRFQRLIRDLCTETGKNVRFIVEGGETELDKTIIENISDPLLHIIRNSIDHGIEDSPARILKKKPAQGTVFLKAYYQGPSVCIEISDDGAGIDSKKVYQKALEKGLVNDSRALTENEIYELMFLPGFTTADEVTSISGRGVGLDVVRQKIISLRGETRVQSVPGEGTTFTLKLPLTLSIIDGLLVKVENERFILPLDFVDKIVVCSHEEIINSYKGLISLDEKKIPYFYLRKEFNIEGQLPDHEELVIINYQDMKIGLAVDKVLGESQVVIKPLGKVFNGISLFSGAAILGDGGLALVLDLHQMISDFSDDPVFNT